MVPTMFLYYVDISISDLLKKNASLATMDCLWDEVGLNVPY